MFERILVPLDGSSEAEAVLPLLGLLVPHVDTELVFLSVVEQVVADAKAEREAFDYLSATAGKLGHVRVRILVETGFPARHVRLVTERERATLIAMTTQGRGGLVRRIAGSVAEAILRNSPVPVLVTRPGIPHPLSLRNILVPIGGGDVSLRVLPHVARLSDALHASVTLLHVSPEPDVDLVRAAEERLRESGLTVRTRLETGSPPVVIQDIAHEPEFDLVAMTTHGRAGLPRILLGSVAERVLRETRIPLLIARAERVAVATAGGGVMTEVLVGLLLLVLVLLVFGGGGRRHHHVHFYRHHHR